MNRTERQSRHRNGARQSWAQHARSASASDKETHG